jgi:hypothetical protein
LHATIAGGKRVYPPCFENAGLVWRRMSVDQKAEAADRLAITVDELEVRILTLPRQFS